MALLLNSFSMLKPGKILVAGDLLLDTYTIGKAKRISPEAPVAVINVQKEESRPGGAGNAILNMVSLGAKVVALGRVGNDTSGRQIVKMLQEERVEIQGILVDEGYKTPLKNRIIADNQQVVRVDHEDIEALSKENEAKCISLIPVLLQDVTVVAISDYGKGFLSDNLLKSLISEANKKQIIVIVDPKGSDFSKYNGAFLIKPNLSEAYGAANLSHADSLEKVADKIMQVIEIEHLMITRSEAGISLFAKSLERQDFPVKVKEVKDVTGAGDTVLAMVACALASGLSLEEAVPLSNVAAGIAIEHIGCARIELSDIAKRLLHDNTDNKIFGEQHLDVLQIALKDKKCVSLSLINENISNELILAMQELKANENHSLVVSVESVNPEESFIQTLAALYQVDFILLNPTRKKFQQALECKASFAFDQNTLKLLT